VVAAIRGWTRERVPVDQKTYDIYRSIANTRKLPKDAIIYFTTGWSRANGLNINVWWIDLHVKTGDTTGYTFRIRDGKLRSQLLPADERSRFNLEVIAMAFHKHHDSRNVFPLAQGYQQNGKPAMSWRVAILPFIEQQALYERYDRNEPWDSEHNRKLLSEIPSFYRHPMGKPDSTNTSYFVLTGPETIFDGDRPNTADIHDSSASTLLLVEAKRNTPWTKPDDIPYAADRPLPKFGGWFEGGFNAAFADGHVVFLPDSRAENVIRAFITKASAELVPQTARRARW